MDKYFISDNKHNLLIAAEGNLAPVGHLADRRSIQRTVGVGVSTPSAFSLLSIQQKYHIVQISRKGYPQQIGQKQICCLFVDLPKEKYGGKNCYPQSHKPYKSKEIHL